DAAGRPLWQRRLAAAAWAVNVSGDGRWAVAALGDGTIRWHRLADGDEQMALFAHPDRERWVLWAPSGHYDTSVGGEALIGWHLNTAANRSAQFFSVGRFRKHYYRPDVIKAVFEHGDLALALRQASAEDTHGAAGVRSTAPAVTSVLPPRIELRGDPETAAGAAAPRARFAVFSPADAPVQEVRIRVAGRLAHTLEGDKLPKPRGDAGIDIDVPLQWPASGAADVVVVARNRNGVSEPATFRIERASAAGPAAAAASGAAKAAGSAPGHLRYRRIYVVAAGVSSYPTLRAELQLKFPSKDARDFVEIVKTQAAGLADQVQVRLLTDAAATRGSLLDALAWIRQQVGPDDLGVVFLAGHGFMLRDQYHFAGSDIDLGSEERGMQTAVPGSAIQDALSNLRGRGVFFIDTCHSGFALSELKINTDVTGALNGMGDERAVVILAGSAGRQTAAEADEWNNGAFTKAIVEGMRGHADYARSGVITPPLLHTYVSGRVRSLTEGQQTPKMVGAVFDEPIAVIRR
ncbi:MAG TPA: caspase family protein, partial [Burkholderiaceae bacterium]|nr:caspase family protein [Burkholderiaceae bacterium]